MRDERGHNSQVELLSGLLPSSVQYAESRNMLPSGLFPQEKAEIAGAVPRRVSEFATGRRCAREALEKLGLPGVAIRRGSNRQPIWPQGVVGSITHCQKYCAAAVAMKCDMLSLGIDAEIDRRFSSEMAALVLTEEEHAREGQSPLHVNLPCLAFSAKESAFKAWHPLTGLWLDFHDIYISFCFTSMSFEARVSPSSQNGDQATHVFPGKFCIASGIIFTASYQTQPR